MKLYRISQDINNGYDTYDSAVVCAENEDEARKIHPSGNDTDPIYGEWVNGNEIGMIQVEYLGKADKAIKKGVVLSSFNAG